jgi:hypothetical protein
MQGGSANKGFGMSLDDPGYVWMDIEFFCGAH